MSKQYTYIHTYLFESGSVAHINTKEKHYTNKTNNRHNEIQKQRKLQIYAMN